MLCTQNDFKNNFTNIRGGILTPKQEEKGLTHMFVNADQLHAVYVCQICFFYFHLWSHIKQLVSIGDIPDEGLWHKPIVLGGLADKNSKY